MSPSSGTKKTRNKIGTRSCAAAIFLYLDDDQRDKVWRRIRRIGNKEGAICGERFREKSEFLAALSDWSGKSDPGNSYLCICAHAGSLGINSKSGVKETRISWEELRKAVARPIRYLWLVGCNTDQCLTHWNPLGRTVKHLLMATTGKVPAALLKFFAKEISINHIVLDGEMPGLLKKKAPKLAPLTAFFKPTADKSGFVPTFVDVPKRSKR